MGRLFGHALWIGVMFGYWALADYGRSFLRPLTWLVASGFVFYWGYGKVLAPLMPKAQLIADKYEHAVGMAALGNAVPFVGPLTIDSEIRKFLFCGGDVSKNCLAIPPDGFQLLVVAQNLFSRLRILHLPSVAQLFQDQVTGRSRRGRPFRVSVTSDHSVYDATNRSPSAGEHVSCPTDRSLIPVDPNDQRHLLGYYSILKDRGDGQ